MRARNHKDLAERNTIMNKEDNITIDEMEKKDGATMDDINTEETSSIIADSAEEAATTESTTEESQEMDGEELLRQLNMAGSGHTTVATIDQIIEETREWMGRALTIEEENVTIPDWRKNLVTEIMTYINNRRSDELARMIYEEVSLRIGTNKEITRSIVSNFNRLLPVQAYLPTKIICDILAQAGIVKILDFNGEEGARDERAELLIYRLHDRKGTSTIYKGVDESGSLEEPDVLRYISALSSKTNKAQRNEMISLLREIAPRVYAPAETDNNYIYAPNGIIDCHGIRWNPIMGLNMRPDGSTATFIPWGTPEAETIIAKEYPLSYSTAATYIDNISQQPPIMYSATGRAWDPVNGIKAVFYDEDEASPALIWQIIQATLRGTNYGHATIFANRGGSRGGGNAKDTIMGIIKELLGEYNTMAVSIHDLGTLDFPLDGLQNAAGIFSSEEDGGKTKAKLFKLLARQDGLIEIRRKHLPTLYIKWRGATIWCMNEDSINFTDKSDSVWRDIIVLTFEKKFKGADKIKEVKDIFIHKKETRDYVLWHAINKTPWIENDYDPNLIEAMEKNRKAMREQSNPVFIFLNEMMIGNPSQDIEPKIPWTQIPAAWLYSIYRAWARKDNAMDHITATVNVFTKQVAQWAEEHNDAFNFEEGNRKLGKKDYREKLTKQDCPALGEYRPPENPRMGFVGGKAVIHECEAEKQYRNRLVRINPLEGWED